MHTDVISPLHEQGPATYRDGKKLLWMLSIIGPVGTVIGPVMYLAGHGHPIWFFLGTLVIYGAVPLMDYLFGEDPNNPPEAAVARLENTGYYRWILYLLVPTLWAAMVFNGIFLATHELRWYEWLATAAISSALMGLVLTISHELGHKKDWFARKLGLFNSAVLGYGHFSIEHNRGHHRHVATPEDPASSKMGESIYRFACRELPGAFFRAWDLELERLERAGKSAWHLDNEILQGWLFTGGLYGGLIYLFGWKMALFLAIVSVFGAFQLTMSNYVEHYGLIRQKLPNGRYEPCQPHHSWNSNHIVSNLILFHLQRHSDHHANPTRGYQSLRNFPDLPSLPSGYFGMFVVALIPPLWFAIMDKRLVETVKGDVSRINFLPAKRNGLMRRFGLTEKTDFTLNGYTPCH